MPTTEISEPLLITFDRAEFIDAVKPCSLGTIVTARVAALLRSLGHETTPLGSFCLDCQAVRNIGGNLCPDCDDLTVPLYVVPAPGYLIRRIPPSTGD